MWLEKFVFPLQSANAERSCACSIQGLTNTFSDLGLVREELQAEAGGYVGRWSIKRVNLYETMASDDP